MLRRPDRLDPGMLCCRVLLNPRLHSANGIVGPPVDAMRRDDGIRPDLDRTVVVYPRVAVLAGAPARLNGDGRGAAALACSPPLVAVVHERAACLLVPVAHAASGVLAAAGPVVVADSARRLSVRSIASDRARRPIHSRFSLPPIRRPTFL